MRIPVGLLFGAAFLLGCANRERHEALAKAAKKASAHLCESWSKEGGGCNADCLLRGRARHARQSLLAAKELSQLPKIEDPETEALLVGLRAAAAAVTAKLEAACPVPIGPSEPLTDAIRACEAAAGAASSETEKQRRLFAEFAHDVDERVGVEIKDGIAGCGS